MALHQDGSDLEVRNEELTADAGGRPRRRGAPGKSTLTSRLGASPASIARAVVAQLRSAESGARDDLGSPDVLAVAAQGTSGAGGQLPFLDEIQRAFGHHDVSGVRAHVGGAAAEAAETMGAVAYAAGDAVAFAHAPDLHLAAHEAAHVVQQRGGVRLSDGVGRAGDDYERHADAVADAVVRGESAQALLDPFSHRGPAGGPAVQREVGPGLRALQALLLRTPSPPAADVVAIIRQHARERRAIVAEVRRRCGAELAAEVDRAAAILPEQAALAAVPPPGAEGPDLRAPAAHPPARETPGPSVASGDDGVAVSARPDENSSVRARVRPSGADGSPPALRDVRVVVGVERENATGELSTTVRGDGGASAEAEGAVRTDNGTVVRGQAEVEIEPGEEHPEARASAGATVEVPLDDRNTLIAGGVINSNGELELSLGVDVLHQRVRSLPLSEASRRPLLRLFVDVRTPLAGGTPEVSGGARVQFSRGGVGTSGDAHERHADAVADAVVRGESAQSLLDSLLGPAPSAAPAVQRRFEPPRNLQGRSSDDLVALARRLDGQLRSAPEADRPVMARTLVQIYEILQERVNRGEFQPHGADDTSPLAGLLDDLAPFGNLDQWIVLSGERPRVRRRPPRPRPSPSPSPGPQPQPEPGQSPPPSSVQPQPSVDGVDLGRSDIAPDNVDPSGGSDLLNGVSVGLDIIGLIVAEILLAEAALAIAGPILGGAGHVIALEEGVENHERAGRSLGIRSAIAYSLFTSPPPAHIRLPAVQAYYYNSTALQGERNRLTMTGISAGTRIDEAIRGGMSTAASSMNSAIDRCDAEYRRRLQERAHRAPTAEELNELRRQVWQAVADRVAQ